MKAALIFALSTSRRLRDPSSQLMLLFIANSMNDDSPKTERASQGKWWEYVVIFSALIVWLVSSNQWRSFPLGPVGYVVGTLLLVLVVVFLTGGITLLLQSDSPFALVLKYALLFIFGLVAVFGLVKFIKWAWYY